MATNRIIGDLQVFGRVTATNMTVPGGAVSNSAVASDAGVDADKLQHFHYKTYKQEASGNAAAATEVLHVARAAGTIDEFLAGLITPPDTAVGSSGRTAVFDLKKNGTTVLSGTISLDSTNVAYSGTETGTLSVPAYVAGDVFTVVVTVGGSAGTHAKGIFAQAIFREAA